MNQMHMERRPMKKFQLFVLFLVLIQPGWSLASVAKPQNVTLTPGVTTMVVSWRANSDDTVGYYVSWGTSTGALDNRYTVSSSKTNSYTIDGLSPNTLYYVQISAFNSENTVTTDSDSVSAKTFNGLSPPFNFSVTSLEDIMETSIGLSWDRPDMDDLAGYKIYYQKASDSSTSFISVDANLTKSTLSNLEPGARYYISVTSRTDSAESAASPTLVVDTAPDTMPPQAPSALDVQLSGDRIITIKIGDATNAGMVDLKGYLVTVMNEGSGGLTVLDVGAETVIDIGEGTSHEEVALEDGSRYTITVKAYDQAENESKPSSAVTVTVEGIQHILIDADGVASGCFIGEIQSSGIPWRAFGWVGLFSMVLLIMKWWPQHCLLLFLFLFFCAYQGSAQAGLENAVGVKAGYFKMSDPLMKETFEERFPVPVKLYYERALNENLHVDIDAGFLKLEGHMPSTSGEKTEAQNTFVLVPLSLSCTYHHYLTPYFYAYLGGGLDHWYVKEEISDSDDEKRQSRHVGGYHYKVGVAYLTQESDVSKRYGVQLEALQAIIDRFGKNDLDLGGITIQAGYFYRF